MSLAKALSGRASSVYGSSYSTTRPESITATLSLRTTVCSLCAMVRTVASRRCVCSSS